MYCRCTVVTEVPDININKEERPAVRHNQVRRVARGNSEASGPAGRWFGRVEDGAEALMRRWHDVERECRRAVLYLSLIHI